MAYHLLFSKSLTKRANTKLNFEDDSISIFNGNISVITINSGHHDTPATKATPVINYSDRETSEKSTFSNGQSRQLQNCFKIIQPNRPL